MALPGQLLGQVPQRLGRPPQRRHRIAPLIRLHQPEQGRGQLRVVLVGALASTAGPARPPDRQRVLAGLQLGDAPAHRGRADPARLGDRADPAMPQQPSLGRQRQSLLTLVQMRQQHLEPCGQADREPRHRRAYHIIRRHIPEEQVVSLQLHKIANVLGALPKSAHPGEEGSAEIWNAEDRAHALDAVASFKAAYGAKFAKAVAKITDDVEVLLAFYDFPAEHWIHLRTTNPIESTFATVRLRTKVTKGPGSRAAGVAMAFKLIESAQDRWRAVNAPHLVALVRAGATFVNGKLVERPDDHARQTPKPPKRSSSTGLDDCSDHPGPA